MKKLMESEKMKNELKKEIRMNVNFLLFVKKIIEEKKESVNVEKLGEEYENSMGLNYSNCERVINRVNRKELREIRNSELNKLGVSIEKFESLSEKIKKGSKKKSDNYLSVRL